MRCADAVENAFTSICPNKSMFLFAYVLCVECSVLYSWGPNVQARGGANHLASALYVPIQKRLTTIVLQERQLAAITRCLS